MPTLKRTSDAASLDSPNPKRTRLSTTELQLLEKETLIKHVLALQKELGTVESRPAASDAAPALSDEKIEEKAEQARKLMVRGFKSQMKWKPTCKNGTAKFSYSGVITSAAVFKRLFNLPADHKKKLFQMDHGAFAEVAGDRIRTSVRYDYLELTGNGVSVRWKEDEGTFSVGGTYGK